MVQRLDELEVEQQAKASASKQAQRDTRVRRKKRCAPDRFAGSRITRREWQLSHGLTGCFGTHTVLQRATHMGLYVNMTWSTPQQRRQRLARSSRSRSHGGSSTTDQQQHTKERNAGDAIERMQSRGLMFNAAQVTQLLGKFRLSDRDTSSGWTFRVSSTGGLTGAMSPLLVRRLFQICDTDGSGSIDQREFLVGLSACTAGTKEQRLSLAFDVHDLNGDGYLVTEELEAMLSSYVIGSAKLAVEACNVVELEDKDLLQDFDIDENDDDWADVLSLLPSGGTTSLSAAQEADCAKTISDFVAAIMEADRNKDGKLSKQEFMDWVRNPNTNISDQRVLQRWMDMFTRELAS